MNSEGGKVTFRKHNKTMIANDEKCQAIIEKMRDVEEFIRKLGFLLCGRDYILIKDKVFSIQNVSAACELTLGSVISCCEAGCVADANSLLRKYRDDLFFYLYIEVFHSSNMRGEKATYMGKMEDNIDLWINGKLENLYGTIVQAQIGTSPRLKDAVKKYELQSFFLENW